MGVESGKAMKEGDDGDDESGRGMEEPPSGI